MKVVGKTEKQHMHKSKTNRERTIWGHELQAFALKAKPQTYQPLAGLMMYGWICNLGLAGLAEHSENLNKKDWSRLRKH